MPLNNKHFLRVLFAKKIYPQEEKYGSLVPMGHSFILISLILVLAATVGALAFGLFALFKGGDFNRKYGNRAMQGRILLQAIALALFTLMLLSGK